jgi:hypothetical protein
VLATIKRENELLRQIKSARPEISLGCLQLSLFPGAQSRLQVCAL